MKKHTYIINRYIQEMPEKKKYLVLVCLGILSSGLLYYTVKRGIDFHLIKSYMGGRIDWLNVLLEEVFRGDLPSLNKIEDHDLTYYLYLSYLGVAMDIKDAEHLFFVLQMLGYGIVLLVYPSLWYYLTKSWIVGIATPLLVMLILRPMLWSYCNDSYWSMAWTIIMGIPLVGSFYISNRKKKGVFIAICIVIALGNIPRGHSSMGITIIFLSVVINSIIKKHRKNIKRIIIECLGSVIIVIFSYQSFTNIIPQIFMKINHQETVLENSPVWHTLYVGLGWKENKYNIIWDDRCGLEAVKKINPNVEHNTKEYHKLIKQVYISLIKKDVGFIIQNYLEKLIVCVKVTFRYLINSPYLKFKSELVGLIIMFLYLNKYLFKYKKQLVNYKGILANTIFCAFQALIFPMMATIGDPYFTGTFAAVDMFLFIVIVICITNFHNMIWRWCRENNNLKS